MGGLGQRFLCVRAIVKFSDPIESKTTPAGYHLAGRRGAVEPAALPAALVRVALTLCSQRGGGVFLDNHYEAMGGALHKKLTFIRLRSDDLIDVWAK